jgi:hypothetical protein
MERRLIIDKVVLLKGFIALKLRYPPLNSMFKVAVQGCRVWNWRRCKLRLLLLLFSAVQLTAEGGDLADIHQGRSNW